MKQETSTGLAENILARLSELIAAQMGLDFPRDRWRDLERKFDAVAHDLGFEDVESCVRWLVSSPSLLTKSHVEILASHLTVGETYFFREEKSFAVLRDHVLPELIHSRRGTEQRLRIWSAGCCTGEEPYSIAILLSRMIPDLENWNVKILATDINSGFLRAAAEGRYREWAFRSAPQRIRERYFKQTENGCYEILPHIREMVQFSYLNLAEDVYPSLLNGTNAMDVIFCRNVLMYFAPEPREKVVRRLYRSLVDGGWLIVSLSEVSPVLYRPFVAASFPGVSFYRQDRQQARPAQKVEAAMPSPVPQTLVERDLEPASQVKPRRTLYEEALALYEQGHYAEAGKKLERLFSLQAIPDAAYSYGKAAALLARCCANQGRLAEALEWCEKSIAADKQSPSCHYLRATILQEQDQPEQSVGALRRTLYLDESFVLAHFVLGNLARQRGQLKKSEKHFDNALSLLSALPEEGIVPESEGMMVGRLGEIIRAIKESLA
ncbi:MAG: CheR family methyltransferase [Anaerolineae bacterium]